MIRLESIGKCFRLYRRPLDRVLEMAASRPRHQLFWALRNINLVVEPGRTVGIIGPNGAGKSTLLKIITGTLLPTEGTVEVQGRIAGLLELGTGFHAEFTGRQNIWINGQLLGLSAEEIAVAESRIIDFSELGEFIDRPLRTYSSGMVVRLGFAVAACVSPKVLIVDEALSVGDARFAQKCIRRIREFRDSGVTILFVSHDPGAISTLCDEVMVLDRGHEVCRARPADALDFYNALLARTGEGNVAMKIHNPSREFNELRRSGTFQAAIIGIEVLSGDGEPARIFTPGTTLLLKIHVMFFAPLENPTVGFLIKDRLGLDVYGTNTARQNIALGRFEPGDRLTLEARLPLDFNDGDYSITVAVHSNETHLDACYDWTDHYTGFAVRSVSAGNSVGLVRLDTTLESRRLKADSPAIASALAEVFRDLSDPVSLERETPSPFLSGFFPVERAGDKPFRWTGARALLALRPAHQRLVLRAAGHGRREPVAVRLGIVGHGNVFEGRIAPDPNDTACALPPELVGQPCLLQIETDPPFREPSPGGDRSPRELGIAIYDIRTTE